MNGSKKKKMMMKKKKIAAGSRSIICNTTEANDVVVVELTEDLILEILSHLPPISLLRFKSVSKTWYSLISNPDFLCRNTANQFDRRKRCSINDLPPPSILLRRYEFAGDSRILTIPPPPNDLYQPYYNYFHQKVSPLLLQKLIDYRPEHDDEQHQVHGDDEKGKFWVIDSCNGLLLYRNSVNFFIPPTGKYNLYVCNPITHDYIKLPTFEQVEREQGFKICSKSSPNIVFDPSVSLTYKVFIWLTCSTTTIDHKTISSPYWKKEQHYRLYVYSSVTRSWKLSISTNQFPVPLIRFNSIQRGVLCNSVLYWISGCPSFHPNVCLCYDVEKDVISTLNFPKMPLEYTHRALLYFGECGGRLRLIETYYKEQQLLLQLLYGDNIYVFPSIFDVMELDNNDDLWTVKYRVNIGDDYYANLIRKETRSLFGVHILDIYKTKTKNAGEQEVDQGEEEEEEVLLLRIGDICIIPFNLSSNTFGMQLRIGEKKSVRARYISCTEVLRYNTITLFPPSLSS